MIRMESQSRGPKTKKAAAGWSDSESQHIELLLILERKNQTYLQPKIRKTWVLSWSQQGKVGLHSRR